VQVKTKQLALLTIALTLTFLLTNLTWGQNSQTNTVTQTSPAPGLTITQHNITAQELQQLSQRASFSQETNQTQKVDGHGTGLTSLTAEDLANIAQEAQVIDSITYQSTPGSFDNTATGWFPPIGNQDGIGSCATWAVGYYMKTYQEAKEHNWNLSGATWDGGYYGHPTTSYQDKIMSPQFVYTLVNDGVDGGTNFENAIDLIANIGVCSWQKMPYSTTDYTSWASEAAWTEAAYYRSSKSPTYEYLYANTDSGIASLKNWLASGNLALIAIDANQYDSLTSQDLIASYTFDRDSLNHANTIVGYNDTVGAFKIANSWGKGGWEHVADGCYYLSYDAMKSLSNYQNPIVIFNDLTDYQPEIFAKFQITHNLRAECTITIGYGTSTRPVATKTFNNYVSGGSHPFCSNNIVVDITEFKSSLTGLYNQPFYLNVYDSAATSTTGTVNYFAIQNSASPNAPKTTRNSQTITLAVNCTLNNPTLTVSPTTGNSGTQITLIGAGFTGDGTVNLAYLNPATSTWMPIANNVPVSTSNNFTYSLSAPDLGLGNTAGDHSQSSDAIRFAATDNSSNQTFTSTNTFSEYRKGLTQVGSVIASGMFGNNSDLSGQVAVQASQSLVLSGRGFSQGTLTAVYDGLYSMGSIDVGSDGSFNGTLSIPSQGASGKHTVTLGGVGGNFIFQITRLPQIVSDYDGNWHNADFAVNLSADGAGVSEIYYKINEGSIQSVGANGQPQISTEGAGNTLEYWGTWSGGTSVELTHNTLSTIKLDKTAPSGSLRINDGTAYCSSTSVTLTVNGQDATSGLQQMRFSNDGTWDTETWQAYSSSVSCILASGDGLKTVYCQIMDNAGYTATLQASIRLDTTKPSIDTSVSSVNVVGSNAQFSASSTDQSGIAAYNWDFGDSTTAQGQQVNHVYAQAGNYTVKLSVNDNAGNTAESVMTVNVATGSQNSNPTPSTSESVNTNSTPSTHQTIPEFSTETIPILAIFFLLLVASSILVRCRSITVTHVG
jgi:PKD repeat protein